jgi:hypothetical protein
MVEEYRKQEEMEEEMERAEQKRMKMMDGSAPCKEPAKPSPDLRSRTSTQRWQGTEMGC